MLQRGFSLVELSIVLVILGLLTGGILGGQNLMHAAELRSVAKEYENYQMAVNTFKDKYFALPGDMNNATQFWGAADTSGTGGECGDPGNDVGTGTETCNGDGDGNVGASGERPEMHRFWQHLANAGLINGEFTGTQGSGGQNHVVPGENAPRSKFGSAGWTVTNYGYYAGDGEMHEYDYGTFMQLGAASPSDITWYQAFTAEDVWNIDMKIDDGRPGRGKVLIEWWDVCSTAATNDDYDGDYLLSADGEICSIIFPKAI